MAISLSDISEFNCSASAHPAKSTIPLIRSAATWTESEPEMIFSTTVQHDGSRVVVALEGELDMATVGDFEEVLLAVEQTAPTVILDLAPLKFVDCSGLHSFIAAQKRIGAAGGRLLFTRGPRAIERVFTLTRVANFFEFVEEDISA